MKHQIAFVLAPYYSRISPHLGLGYLRSCLEARGYETAYFDFSAEYYRGNKFIRGFYNKVMIAEGNSAYAPLESILKCFLKEKDIDQSRLLADRFLRSQAEELAGKILAGKPAAVGFSIYDSTLLFSLYIARAIKKIAPETATIFGGPFLADWDIVGILNQMPGLVVHVVIGEAEQSLVELASYLTSSRPAAYPKGCLSLPADIEKDYEKSPLVTDLDTIPFPEYRDAPFSAYLRNVRFEMINLNLHTTGEICLPVTMGRGCPYSCNFCGHNAYWTRYRLRSVDRVIEEMVHLNERYGCRVFRFNDSLINLKSAWLEDFCDRLIKDNLKFYWYGHARADGMDERVAEKMYAAGCRFLKFGLEHASNRILELMNKGTNVETNRRALRITDRVGMKCRANFIYCFPGETRAEMEETISFILENRPYYDVMRYMKFVLIPRSKVALMPQAFNVELEPFQSTLSNPDLAAVLNHIPKAWRSPDFTDEELNYRGRRVAEAVGHIMEDEIGGLLPPTFPDLIEERFHDDARLERDEALVTNMEALLKGEAEKVELNHFLKMETTPYELEIMRAAPEATKISTLLKVDREGEKLSADARREMMHQMLFKGFLRFSKKEGKD